MFGEDFVWGVASSAYQVEGTDAADGRGACVWDMFAADGRVFEHQNADTSCDHMHHYKEDIALMRHLGIRAYRFSLNWARILPEGTGRVNEKAIAMYRDMILTMKENGITPYLTLFHWEFPQALYEQNWRYCATLWGSFLCRKKFSGFHKATFQPLFEHFLVYWDIFH